MLAFSFSAFHAYTTRGLSLLMLISFLSEGAVLPTMSMPSIASKTTQQSPLNQGIQGKVRQLSGDYMPRDTDESLSNGASNSATQTTIWIFAGRIPGKRSPQWPIARAKQHTGLVCQVETNRHGYYSAVLPVGEYTVFAQYGDNLYLNSFQGDGSYTSIEVVPDQISEMNITNTENAVF